MERLMPDEDGGVLYTSAWEIFLLLLRLKGLKEGMMEDVEALDLIPVNFEGCLGITDE